MAQEIRLNHEFVEQFPERLEQGTIYISMLYATAAHKCACGCGNDVITPITPTDWQLNYDGETISLYPSIGNWSFSCQSHYWIRHNTVEWAPHWTPQQINEGRAHNRLSKARHHDRTCTISASGESTRPSRGIWHVLKSWFS